MIGSGMALGICFTRKFRVMILGFAVDCRASACLPAALLNKAGKRQRLKRKRLEKAWKTLGKGFGRLIG